MKIAFTYSMLITSLFIPIAGCIQNTASPISSMKLKHTMEARPKTAYYIDENADGIFEEIVPEEVPVPFQGKDEFTANLARNVRYPASARENGIAGFVVLEILVDELGFVKEVNVKRSLTQECDEVVRFAFINATTNGYATLKWNSSFVKYKMDYPFGFYLQ